MQDTAYLVLENGKVFKGKSFGAVGEVTAEIAFTTGMTGYLETLTDPSYFGQIVVQTFPLIGNYGVIPSDFESDQIAASGYIVKHWCEQPSNFRSEGDIDAFLKERGVVGLCGIDTRALTKIIREEGSMNGRITKNPKDVDISELKKYKPKNAVENVSVKKACNFKADNGRFKVALMDYGVKENIKRELLARGCDVYVFPHNTKSEEVLALKPDGIMLSNGPGDPKENKVAIHNLQGLMRAGIPTFGICIGHQLLALANGFETEKLKYGHRGENQPAKDKTTGRVYITAQNHGYTVVSESIDESKARELFVNTNDQTCEGIEYINTPAFTVQFHPEACGGPQDTAFLFDRFISMMEVRKNAER